MLRSHRRAAGLSQETLAERSGLSTRGISDLERGINRTPQRETMLRLADALALSGEERVTFERAARRRGFGSGGAKGSALRLPSTVPVPLTALLGRDEAVSALAKMLRGDPQAGSIPVRLVTLAGP
ncbi:MAG: helix-turn-helix transcriptional regulator, partial [Chloroflexota bacterium]